MSKKKHSGLTGIFNNQQVDSVEQKIKQGLKQKDVHSYRTNGQQTSCQTVVKSLGSVPELASQVLEKLKYQSKHVQDLSARLADRNLTTRMNAKEILEWVEDATQSQSKG